MAGAAPGCRVLYTSREVGAEEAASLGLGNELVDGPDAGAWEVAAELASGRNHVRTSEDVREGRPAFLEKRAPRFVGR